MASSYSTDLKLELMVTGENAGTWGDNTNNNLNLIQQAIAGYEAVALTDGGTVALAMTDKTISNARNMVLKFTGTLTTASIVTIPDSIEKFYIFDCSAVVGPTNLTIKTASGTGFTLNAAKIFAAYSDGTNLNEISLDTLGGTIAFADVTGTVSTAQISDNAITTAKISDNQITTAKISDNQITTAKISDNQVTAAKLDDVLTDSGGTAGSYTTVDITVDAQGRITAIADGSAGGGATLFKAVAKGPASGTITSNTGSFLGAFMQSGSGGGGGAARNPNNSPSTRNVGGDGGDGAYGYYTATISAPFSQPFSVGAQGNGGNAGTYGGAPSGNAGGATTIANIGTVNGGNGGSGKPYSNNGGRAASGNPGSAPGADITITTDFFNAPISKGNGGNGGAGTPGNAGYLSAYINDGA